MRFRDSRKKRSGTPNEGAVSSNFKPITENQNRAYQAYRAGKNPLLTGYAGTGKTYLACAFALESLQRGDVATIRLIRSAVPSRDIGFLPGTEAEKLAVYEKPYEGVFTALTGRGDTYQILKQKRQLVFESSSFLRGMTYDANFIIVDEFQNMSFQELNTIITRFGVGTRAAICGDIHQTDLATSRSGFSKLNAIIDLMPRWFTIINMTSDDIVRSPLVKDYLMALDKLNEEQKHDLPHERRS